MRVHTPQHSMSYVSGRRKSAHDALCPNDAVYLNAMLVKERQT